MVLTNHVLWYCFKWIFNNFRPQSVHVVHMPQNYLWGFHIVRNEAIAGDYDPHAP